MGAYAVFLTLRTSSLSFPCNLTSTPQLNRPNWPVFLLCAFRLVVRLPQTDSFRLVKVNTH